MKRVLLGLVLFSLTSCYTPQENRAYYDSMPASKICYDYYNLPSGNIWQGYRAETIQRRGLDCQPYVGEALKNKGVREALIDLGTSLSQNPAGRSSGYLNTTGFTKVCNYNGPGGPAAITVPSTSICPLTHAPGISGFTQICSYPNEIGGPKAFTVSSTSICPVVYPR
jgi:hypothetical protein